MPNAEQGTQKAEVKTAAVVLAMLDFLVRHSVITVSISAGFKFVDVETYNPLVQSTKFSRAPFGDL